MYINKETIDAYKNALIGTQIPYGNVISGITTHAVERAIERGFSAYDIKETLYN
jgi:hypothetical protein